MINNINQSTRDLIKNALAPLRAQIYKNMKPGDYINVTYKINKIKTNYNGVIIKYKNRNGIKSIKVYNSSYKSISLLNLSNPNLIITKTEQKPVKTRRKVLNYLIKKIIF